MTKQNANWSDSPRLQAAKAQMRLHGDNSSHGLSKLKEPKPHERENLMV